MGEDEILQDNPNRKVVRIGNTVRRPVHPWTSSIHALLNHLEQAGFPYSPRVLGIDDEGREVLTYIEGESGPKGWVKIVDERGLDAFAHLLRDYHEAVASFRFTELPWALGTRGVDDAEVVCHGDFGPWNIVWKGFEPVGIIDWDYAHPSSREYDVAYALEYVAPFRDDANCVRSLRYPAPPDRASRLRRFVASYGDRDMSIDWVERVISVQREGLELVRDLADRGCEPQVTWVADGYLDELQHRIRWSEDNRDLFQR